LKYILTEKHGYRVAVILNEYADEEGIESAFLQDAQVRLEWAGLDWHKAALASAGGWRPDLKQVGYRRRVKEDGGLGPKQKGAHKGAGDGDVGGLDYDYGTVIPAHEGPKGDMAAEMVAMSTRLQDMLPCSTAG
jgi:hypothetical protein